MSSSCVFGKDLLPLVEPWELIGVIQKVVDAHETLSIDVLCTFHIHGRSALLLLSQLLVGLELVPIEDGLAFAHGATATTLALWLGFDG